MVTLPLTVQADQDQASDLAVDLRDELKVGEGARDGVELYTVGQEALWAGMQDLAKEDLEKARSPASRSCC